MQNLGLPPIITQPRPSISRTPLLLGGFIVAGFLLHAFLLRIGSIAYFMTQIGLTLATPVVAIWLINLLTIGRNRCSPAERRRILSVLVTMVALVMLFFLLPIKLILLDMSARDHVNSVAGEARLQTWAEDFLKKPIKEMPILQQSDNPFSDRHTLDIKQLPPFVRAIPVQNYPKYTCTLMDDGTGNRYLRIDLWNRRPHSYGIILFSKDHKISPPKDKMLFEWQDGLYGWQAINERD